MNPIIVIGAPRSGTNMLRDALVAVPGFATWPCDEINYIWRHGNLRYSTDEFPVGLARPEVRRFIRDRFARLADRSGAQWVVEKTCANALRIGFVDSIVPEARYVYIRRNALDAIASAVKRWQAPLNFLYIMRKARFIPPSDAPYYALRYSGNRLHKLMSGERRLASWGPRFDGMGSLLRTRSLPEVCAHQWKRCVESAERTLATLPQERVCQVHYEQFVNDASGELARIFSFLGASVERKAIDAAVQHVTAASVGRGELELGEAGLELVRAIVDDL